MSCPPTCHILRTLTAVYLCVVSGGLRLIICVKSNFSIHIVNDLSIETHSNLVMQPYFYTPFSQLHYNTLLCIVLSTIFSFAILHIMIVLLYHTILIILH